MKDENDQRLVRPVCLSDLDEVARIDQAAFPVISYPRFTFRQFYDVFAESFFVCEHQAALCGYALFAPKGDRLVYLLAIATDPAQRRRGVAAAMIAKGLKRARDRGLVEARLTVSPDNPALSLYQGFGFREIGQEASYYGGESPRIVMAAKL